MLLTGGSVSCFGDANYGTLGGGGAAPTTLTPTATPVAVTTFTTATQLAAGYRFNCALLSDGTAPSWAAASCAAGAAPTSARWATAMASTGARR